MSRLLAYRILIAMVFAGAVPPLVHPARAQPLPDRVPLGGVVVDQDGKPLKDVYLALRRQNSDGGFSFWGAETASDAEGRFTFPGVEEGGYYLNTELKGYAPVLNRSVDWNKRSTSVRIQLTRLASARLRVLAIDGTPLVQQPVWLRLQSTNGETTIHSLRTDSRGVLLVPNLAAATYAMWAHTASGYASRSLELRYNPAATPIDVPLQNGGNLKVMARDSDGVLLGGAAFVLSPENPEEASRLGSVAGNVNDDYALLAAEGDRAHIVTQDGTGLLELRHLPAGRYSARLVLPGFTTFAPRIVEVANGQTTPLEWSFAARRAGSLTLDLRTLDDKPVANREVTVRVLPINTNGTLARESVDENGFAMPFFPSGTGARRATSDANGRLRLFPLRPGRYRVFVAPRAVDSSLAPNKESAPFDLDVGQSGATMTVMLP